MKLSLQEIAEAVGARLVGDGRIEVGGVASIGSAAADDLVFVEDEKFLAQALESGAAAVITGEFRNSSNRSKPLLFCTQPKLAFALAARALGLGAGEASAAGVHAAAVVPATARIAVGVVVGAYAVVGEGSEIGERTHIGAGCAIGAAVRIGRSCVIYPNVTIYAGTTIGDRVVVHAGAVLGSDGFGYVRDRATGRYQKFPQVGRLVIEDDVEIGANTTIDRGALEETRIGRGTKIDNLVHIGHNCRIAEDVVIAAQTGLSGSITIKKGVVLGGQVGVGERACIQEGVMVGGQGGVLPNKILRGRGEPFWGTPAQPLRQYLKQLAVVAKLARKENKEAK
jgi:UDP-3-O-[3-hydroxymyristoyl] glucosamine N-acyltransferase